MTKKPRDWASVGLNAVAVLVLLFLLAPALAVIPISFSGGLLSRFPDQISLEAYTRVLNDRGWLSSALFSFEIAIAVMLVSIAIGTLTAFGILRSTGGVRRTMEILVLIPVLVPTIIFGLAIYWLLAEWNLLGTLLGFVLAELIVALPYAIITIRAGVEKFDQSLIRAALVLGARPPRIIVKIVVPLLLPALIAGGLFAFLIAFDEVVVALFLSSPSAVTLSKRIWDAMLYQWDPAVSALSTMQIGLTSAILIALALLQRKGSRAS